MEKNEIKDLNQFVNKVNQLKKQDLLDLSSDEDLSIAIMNLVSIEEHFFFSGGKTGDSKYYELIKVAREMRKQLLKKLVKDVDDGSERWCISKHLLAASMRLMEVGTKALGQDRTDEAYDLFQKAFDLYSLFWGLNLKAIGTDDVKKIDEQAINKHDTERKGFLGKLGELVKKAIDCCKE